MRVALLCVSVLCGCSEQNTVMVSEGQLPQRIEVSGQLLSADSQNVLPPVVDRVWQFQINQLVPEGSAIEQGQVLARLDTSELRERIKIESGKLRAKEQDAITTELRNQKKFEQMTLDLAEAEMLHDKAERKALLSDETVTQIEREKREIDELIAAERVALVEEKLRLERLRAQQRAAILHEDQRKLQMGLTLLETGLERMTLRAPRDGIVVYGTDPSGEKLSVGDSIYVGDVIATIPNLSHMQVQMAVPEVEASRVALGQSMTIRLDASPEREFHGEVVEIGAVFRPRTPEIPLMVFDVTASISPVDPDLMRPGMTAKISMDVTDPARQALLPSAAVAFEGEQAYVLRPGLFGDQRQDVTVAALGEEQIAIASGIEIGAKVVLP
ncbi:hypothetical protein GCM10023333_16300 [Ferrimonas pelagia]|uniref:CusB-like beta-barrel domain-containing protein n=2 Tax=Ferrimonas pelagia TaxID=1177826 RepID=A0ABP9EM52_9GAMM